MLSVQNNAMLPIDLEEKAIYLKELGVSNFEIDGSEILNNLEEVKKMTKHINVDVVCGGYRNWIGSYEKEQRDECIEDITNILKGLKEIGGKGIVVPGAWALGTYRLPAMHPKRDVEDTFKVLSESLLQLDKVCQELGTFIYLEPLNRYQDFMINTLEDSKKLIVENNLTNVKIMADVYHMNIEEDNLYDAITNNIDLIGHIHLAENHRFEPGTGSIDFARIFAILKEKNYQGYTSLECRFKNETKEAFETSINYLKENK